MLGHCVHVVSNSKPLSKLQKLYPAKIKTLCVTVPIIVNAAIKLYFRPSYWTM